MALGDNYIPIIEAKTGMKTEEFIAEAKKMGFTDPATKPGIIITWLKETYGLGHGHAMAMAHAIKTKS